MGRGGGASRIRDEAGLSYSVALSRRSGDVYTYEFESKGDEVRIVGKTYSVEDPRRPYPKPNYDGLVEPG